MKKSVLSKLKGFLGIILILAAMASIFFWETYGRENLLYKEVVVLVKDIEPRTEIKEDLLTTIKVDTGSLIDNPVIHKSDIIGLESKHFIPRYMQLDKRFFELPGLVPGDDKYIFSIPMEWIRSFPSSVRRKDTVFVYAVENTDIRVPTKDENENVYTNVYKNTLSKDVLEKINNNSPICQLLVAYVKDSANREVVTVGDIDRLDGSANISKIEFIGTTQQFNTLKDLYYNGYKLILFYQ